MSIASMLNKINPDPSKAGKTLLWLNVLSMIFAAASNTFAAATDKNTSKEDKKFLVPAGAVTGAANIGIYFAMTKKIIDKLQGPSQDSKSNVKGLADLAIEKMLKEDTFDKNVKIFVDNSIAKAVKKEKSIFNVGPLKVHQGFSEGLKNKFTDAQGQITQAAKDAYKADFKAGFGVLGAFIGAVVGCAILTPIIRDVSAYFVQKHMEKKNPSMQDKPYMPYFDPSHTKVGMPYQKLSKQPLNFENYLNFTRSNSRMRV